MAKSFKFRYSIFGLNVESALKCPELLPATGEPDVFVEFASVPQSLEQPVYEGVRFQASPGKLLLWVDNLVRFLILDGNTILIDPQPGADDASLRVFLLGSAFGALLHQRKLLPFHGNAIKGEKGTVIFSGASGAGKSTIAAALIKKGYPLVADDICAIRMNGGGKPEVMPGFPRLKLWADSLSELGENPDLFSPVRPQLKKFNFPVHHDFLNTPQKVVSVVIMNTTNTNTFSFRTVNGLEKFNFIKANTYRHIFMEGLGNRGDHFKLATQIGNHIAVHIVTRPNQGFQLTTLTSHVIDKYLS